MDNTELLGIVCAHLSAGDNDRAETVLARGSPYAPIRPVERSYTLAGMLNVFRRDGFIDRYSGDRLIFPGSLRLISHYLPRAFPYHPDWRTSETPFAFWRLSATVDHIVPVSRGDRDDLTNLVTTSHLRNSIKGNWLLDELGWELHPPGDLTICDGLTG
jgi:hypothetical protein